ncbi:MAG: cation diffusion facilitator family transporter, partial [Candidatus Aminicenantes bacterium]|nr:cation diffusion facilitator family transporter [Candidatus Aminicenantes bacterium]
MPFSDSFRPSIKRDRRKLVFALIITASVMVAEAIGGWLSHSLALLSDAGHMLIDVMALSLAWFAFRLSSRPPTPKKSYGYYRAEILAALFNGMILMLVSLYIFYQAYHRFSSPPQIKSVFMILIATIGLAANLSGIWLLSGSRQSLNIKGAYFHMLGDAISSLGVIGAGLIILLTGWVMADPIVSIGIAG